MNNEYPCIRCELKETCNEWDAQFCCTLCKHLYGDEASCDTCNKENNWGGDAPID